jgi:hypothetical protein
MLLLLLGSSLCPNPPSCVQYVGPELDDPSSSECMQFMQQVGRENWKAFANKKIQVSHRSRGATGEQCV